MSGKHISPWDQSNPFKNYATDSKGHKSFWMNQNHASSPEPEGEFWTWVRQKRLASQQRQTSFQTTQSQAPGLRGQQPTFSQGSDHTASGQSQQLPSSTWRDHVANHQGQGPLETNQDQAISPPVKGPYWTWKDFEPSQQGPEQIPFSLGNNHAGSGQDQHGYQVHPDITSTVFGRVYKFLEPEKWDDKALNDVDLGVNFRSHMVVAIKPARRSCGCWVVVAKITSSFPSHPSDFNNEKCITHVPIHPTFPHSIFPSQDMQLKLCTESAWEHRICKSVSFFANAFVRIDDVADVPLRILHPVGVGPNEEAILRFTQPSLNVLRGALDGTVLACPCCTSVLA